MPGRFVYIEFIQAILDFFFCNVDIVEGVCIFTCIGVAKGMLSRSSSVKTDAKNVFRELLISVSSVMYCNLYLHFLAV